MLDIVNFAGIENNVHERIWKNNYKRIIPLIPQNIWKPYFLVENVVFSFQYFYILVKLWVIYTWKTEECRWMSYISWGNRFSNKKFRLTDYLRKREWIQNIIYLKFSTFSDFLLFWNFLIGINLINWSITCCC